jgi:hypothetical protein
MGKAQQKNYRYQFNRYTSKMHELYLDVDSNYKITTYETMEFEN